MSKVVRIDSLHFGDRLKCSVNGSGIRVIVWFCGCPIKCDGCHNEEFWNPNNSQFPDFSEEHVLTIISEMSSHISIYSGLSILGGEPFAKFNIDDVLTLCQRFTQEFPDKDIWIWSGYTWEWLKSQTGEYGEKIRHVLSLCHFLVDGPFIQSRRNISLKFRGSDNQRIIDLKKSQVVE